MRQAEQNVPEFDSLDQLDADILRAMREVRVFYKREGGATAAEINELVDVARSTIGWRLNRLVDLGLAVKDDTGHATYRQTDDGERFEVLWSRTGK